MDSPADADTTAEPSDDFVVYLEFPEDEVTESDESLSDADDLTKGCSISQFRGLNLHPKKCRGEADDIEKMKLVIDNDPSAVHRCGYYDTTGRSFTWTPPLHSACRLLHKRCVQYLMESGARLDQLCKNNKSVIYHMFEDREYETDKDKILEILNMLIEKCTETYTIYLQDHTMYTDMIELIDKGANEPIKILLEKGIFKANVKDLNHKLMERNSPYIAALESPNIEAMKLMLMHGVKITNFIRYGHNKYSLPVYIIHSYIDPYVALRAMKIFYSFGGRVNTIQQLEEGGITETILEALHNKQSGRWVKLIQKDIEEMMVTPLTLQAHCRIAIRNNLGEKYWNSIDKLGLPKDMERYLALDDL